ncbi:CPBP family intramembrane glutamic endopeptidase [Klebsiella pneumoniae]|uniref:CPBP family intramembrane glutamic endopeptidase n=1 Tax=Klebsiella pneumoniae TaxID=573 RepID=UPI001D1927BB|nr:CPBP family intramembrane glutamic endopeptidase [Klebsiella pneumoniae]
MVATLVVPYYEEIVYRVCAFGFLCSIFRKNLLIPSLITSVFFCVMHSQYYNILDQAILFVVSMLLLKVRIKSKGIFYPMVIHAGMNFFVLMLNIL